MKKIAKIALALLLSALMIFAVACANSEEYNYLHDNLDKSKATPEEFTEWMYKRTKTSIKLSRPNSEIQYNVELLMEYYDYLDEYLDEKEDEYLDSKPRKEHLQYCDLLSSDILVPYAKRVAEDKVWVGKTWRDTGRALNMNSNSEYMSHIANQIIARGTPITEYYMYKEEERSKVVEGEEIVEIVKDADNDPATESATDKVRVKFKDAEQAIKIAENFIQNAIYSRPSSQIGELYVLRTMYDFANFIGYDEAYVYEEEYHPGSGNDGENEDGTEIIRTKVALADYYSKAYIAYIGN